MLLICSMTSLSGISGTRTTVGPDDAPAGGVGSVIRSDSLSPFRAGGATVAESAEEEADSASKSIGGGDAEDEASNDDDSREGAPVGGTSGSAAAAEPSCGAAFSASITSVGNAALVTGD